MSDITRILSAMEKGDRQAASQLLPLVYEELRQLAMRNMARETPGQTLSATALVHEAYLRLVGTHDTPQWDSRGHFFAAAAEAMRRILVDNARRKQSLKRGVNLERQDLDQCDIAMPEVSDDVLAVDDALAKLAQIDQQSAELVKLRCFAGLTNVEAAAALGISPRSADRLWAFARAWLYQNIHGT